MAKRWLYASGGSAIIALGVGATTCGSTSATQVSTHTQSSSRQSPEPLQTKRLELAARGLVGVVSMGEWIELESKSEGRVERVLVKPGDEVTSGMIIAEIDNTEMLQELRVAGAELGEAVRQFKRRVPLSRGEMPVISPEELDSAKFAVSRASAQYAKLKRATSEAKVKAPTSGVVSEIYLARGAMAGPGRPILRLIGRGRPEVRFAIPAEASEKIKLGTLVRVGVKERDVLAEAKVTNINPEIDSASQMVFATAELRLSDVEAKLLSTGLVARVFMDNEAKLTAKLETTIGAR